MDDPLLKALQTQTEILEKHVQVSEKQAQALIHLCDILKQDPSRVHRDRSDDNLKKVERSDSNLSDSTLHEVHDRDESTKQGDDTGVANKKAELAGQSESGKVHKEPEVQSVKQKDNAKVTATASVELYTYSRGSGFGKLREELQKLNIELESFGYATQQFGSSSRLLSSIVKFRSWLSGFVSVLSRERAFYASLIPFADNVRTFRHGLDDFPEFRDKTLVNSLDLFADSLEFWNSCLLGVQELSDDSMNKYFDDISRRIRAHIEKIIPLLSSFVQHGMPTIQSTRQYAVSNSLNLITAATLFSGVTATTLQFSFSSTGTPIAVAVNLFWFCSLVCSVGAVVNSMLGLTWTQALHYSPDGRYPWYVSIWIRRSPLVFLAVSVACFLIGLILFTFLSSQPLLIRIITIILTALVCSGVVATPTWFFFDRQMFLHKGRVWRGYVVRFGSRSALSRFLVIASDFLVRHLRRIQSLLASNLRNLNSNAQPLPRWVGSSDLPYVLSVPTRPLDSTFQVPLSTDHMDNVADPSEDLLGDPEPVKALVPKLQALSIAQKVQLNATVGSSNTELMFPTHLHFSHNGEFLVVSSYEPSSEYQSFSIFRVQDLSLPHIPLTRYLGNSDIGTRMLWSPNSTRLMIMHGSHIDIWTEDGTRNKAIHRAGLKSVVWLPSGDGFLTLEKVTATKQTNLLKLDLDGRVLDTHSVGDLRDVAMTQDGRRVFGIARSSNNTGLTLAHFRLIVYNVGDKKIEYQAPLVNYAYKITLASNGQDILVTYRYYTGAAPELWRWGTDQAGVHVSLKRTFMLRGPVGSTPLQCCFGGKNDEFVMCAGETSGIHIWHVETAELLHRIPPTQDMSCLKSITWNRAAEDSLMFATNNQRHLSIWKLPPPVAPSQDEQALEVSQDGTTGATNPIPQNDDSETQHSDANSPVVMDHHTQFNLDTDADPIRSMRSDV